MIAKDHEDWKLLDEFGRLIRELRPELVTMENTPRLKSKDVFHRFVRRLKKTVPASHVMSNSLGELRSSAIARAHKQELGLGRALS
jgi:site-specific DNA-cytosine methylase